MTSPFTARQAGLTSLAAAGLILLSQISQLAIPLAMPESFWIATQSLRMGLALAAMFALLVALIGLYSRQSAAAGRLGLAGFATAILGTMLVAGDWWYEAFIGPALREGAPALLTTAPGGSILLGAAMTGGAFAAGWTLFGLATIRAGVFPRRTAVLLTLAGLAGPLAVIPPFQIPLALAVGWMGLWLVGSTDRAARPASSAVSARA
jgi:hypothetical protein